MEGSEDGDVDVVALDDVLTRLAEPDPRRRLVEELRFFGGMSVNDAAELLSVARSNVEADWRAAPACLATKIADTGQA